jgi:hypothetical protein
MGCADMVESQIVQRQWNQALWLYLPYLLLGAAIALGAPDNGVSGTDAARVFVHAVASVIPSIHPLANISTIPEVVLLFGAVMWVVQPFFTGAVIAVSPRIPVARVSRVWLFVGFPTFLAVLFVFGVLLPLSINPGADDLSYLQGRGRAGLTFAITNRIGLATLGSLIMAVSSFCQVILVKSIPYYVQLLRLNLTRT